MYVTGTVLALKEPKSTDDVPFPYDEVKVIGPSPIDPGARLGEGWEGAEATGVIITPVTSFGSTIDEPFGKLRALYDVKEIPEDEVDIQPTVRRYDATTSAGGPTAEEVFAQEAPGEASVDGERVRTPITPLPDPRPKASDGPLD